MCIVLFSISGHGYMMHISRYLKSLANEYSLAVLVCDANLSSNSRTVNISVVNEIAVTETPTERALLMNLSAMKCPKPESKNVSIFLPFMADI